MGQYILKRLMLLFPTLFFAMMVAFFISKLVPGDTAESMLVLQGVRPESNNAPQEYKKHYLSLGLDLPLFYFSVLPNFYPSNINEIINSNERHLIQELLKQKVPFNYIDDYTEAKKNILESIAIKLNNFDSLTREQVLMLTSKVAFASEISIIQQLWSELMITKISDKVDFGPITIATKSLSNNIANNYLPSFRWHGTKNQFHHWINALVHGQLGLSIKDGLKVGPKILSALKWTILLSILNLLISNIIAIPVGMIAGYWSNGLFDRLSGFIWLVFYSIPVFWLASIFIIYFTSGRYGSWLNIFPTPGSWYIPDNQSFWTTMIQYGHQMILPVICLVANDIAQLSRIIRNNVIAQKSKLYVLMASAKGVNSKNILIKHIFPNVLLPLITIVGSRIPAGLSGALIIEVIFNIPGMGRLMYESIYSADWNVVFGILLIVSLVTILSMLLTDIFYGYANPKIKSAMV